MLNCPALIFILPKYDKCITSTSVFAATNTICLYGDSKKNHWLHSILLGGRHDVIVLNQQRGISNNDPDAEKEASVAVPDLYTKCCADFQAVMTMVKVISTST